MHGLTWETFHQMHGVLNPQVVMALEGELAQYALGVELLLAGVDQSGAHIHTNHDPGGGNQRHDPMGWAAIGIGAPHVIPSMVGYAHSARDGFKETVFRVYASKRRAEVAPGVGSETEMAVVTPEGTKRLTPATIAQLAVIYDRFRKKTEKELHKQLASFDPDGDAG